jgi:secretion/DNA translocation related TadE-like protein
VRGEHGAAVVVALGLVSVLLFVAVVCVGTVALVLAHRRAQVAADLASLAGAAALQRGAEPCAAAVGIAARHDAIVTRCVVDGPSVAVSTGVDLPAALGGGRVPARARAGPVPATSAGRPSRDLHRPTPRGSRTSTGCARSC